MHRSTSVSMAILFNKKILFVYTDYMKRSMEYFYSGFKYLANLLGEKAINISEVTSNTIDLKVNNELYDRYKYNYLTSKEIQGISSSEIFIKNIKG